MLLARSIDPYCSDHCSRGWGRNRASSKQHSRSHPWSCLLADQPMLAVHQARNVCLLARFGNKFINTEKKCADEGGSCTCDGNVRFGVDSRWTKPVRVKVSACCSLVLACSLGCVLPCACIFQGLGTPVLRGQYCSCQAPFLRSLRLRTGCVGAGGRAGGSMHQHASPSSSSSSASVAHQFPSLPWPSRP